MTVQGHPRSKVVVPIDSPCCLGGLEGFTSAVCHRWISAVFQLRVSCVHHCLCNQRCISVRRCSLFSVNTLCQVHRCLLWSTL